MIERPQETEQLSVCLVANARFPIREPFVGGLESMTWHLARELTRRGHRVALFAAPGSDRALRAEELVVPPLPTQHPGRHDLDPPPAVEAAERRAYEDLVDLLKDDGARFDVVHNNSLHPVVLARAAELPAPLLTTLHTPPVTELTQVVTGNGVHGAFAAVSSFTADAWRPYVPAHCVLNGVDTHTWRRGAGGKHVVWTGRLVPEKAPHEAIDAARLAGTHLVLAGPVLDHAYFNAAIAPRLGGAVTYAGHLEQSRLRSLVAGAGAVLVTPAWDEPYGLVAAEALACGTPIAAYDRGGLREVVGPHGRFALPGDTAGLAFALREAMTLDRSAARAHAVRSLSVRSMVDRYEQLYRSLSSPGIAA